jgi:hypothetical protein
MGSRLLPTSQPDNDTDHAGEQPMTGNETDEEEHEQSEKKRKHYLYPFGVQSFSSD